MNQSIYLILTVQPANNIRLGKCRLGFDMETSVKHLTKPLTIDLVLTDGVRTTVNIACGLRTL